MSAMFKRTVPTARDAERFIDLPYSEQDFDCGHLTVLVQKELFGRDLDLPLRHPRGRRGQAVMIGRISQTLVDSVDQPETGDIALYTQPCEDGGEQYHLGTVFVLCGERWLLHVQFGQRSVLQREREATRLGLHLQGYFRCRELSHA